VAPRTRCRLRMQRDCAAGPLVFRSLVVTFAPREGLSRFARHAVLPTAWTLRNLVARLCEPRARPALALARPPVALKLREVW